MNFDGIDHGANRAASIHAFVDAQPDLSPAERAFIRLSMFRYGIDPADVTDDRPCPENCEDAR